VPPALVAERVAVAAAARSWALLLVPEQGVLVVAVVAVVEVAVTHLRTFH